VRETPTSTVKPIVIPPPPAVVPSPTLVRITATAKVDLDIRVSPATAARAVDKLSKGQTAQIVGRNAAKDWWQIPLPTNPNERGWIQATSATASAAVDVIPIVQPGGAPTLSPTARLGFPTVTPTLQRPTPTKTPTLFPGQPKPTPVPFLPPWLITPVF